MNLYWQRLVHLRSEIAIIKQKRTKKFKRDQLDEKKWVVTLYRL